MFEGERIVPPLLIRRSALYEFCMTTLREIGESIRNFVSTSLETIGTQSVVDWPMSVLVFAIVAFMLIVSVIGSLTGGLIGAIIGSAFKKTPNPPPMGSPSEPSLRYLWANREGPYSPSSSERARWIEEHGEPLDR
jgi:hypothetical protein